VSEKTANSTDTPTTEQLELLVQPVCDALESIYDTLMLFGSFTREPAEFGSDVQMDLDIKSKGMVNPENRRQFAIRARLTMTLTNTSNERLATIEGEYLIRYETREGFLVDDQQADLYAQFNGVFNAWGYWREYVQSACCRMGIPAPPVPVYRQGMGSSVSAHLESEAQNTGEAISKSFPEESH